MAADTVAAAGQVAEDLGLAALLGGNLFGRLAMHPAVRGVCTPEDRGRVVSAAWRRYGTVNSLSLAAVLAGWFTTRDQIGDQRLARAKDGAVGAVALTGIASALEGVRFARSARGGSVPLEDGSEPSPQAPPDAARTKRVLNGLGRVSALAEVALVTINAVAAQQPRPRRARLSRR
jgi:hypothetical protein